MCIFSLFQFNCFIVYHSNQSSLFMKLQKCYSKHICLVLKPDGSFSSFPKYICIIHLFRENTCTQQKPTIPERKEVRKRHFFDHEMIKYKLYISGAVQIKTCAYGGRRTCFCFLGCFHFSHIWKESAGRLGKPEKLRST